MEPRRRTLPKPSFSVLKKAYLAIDRPHLCHGILHSEKGLVVSGIRMGEAIAKSVGPIASHPDEHAIVDPRPGLSPFDYELFAGKTCRHGYPLDAESFELFLTAHWGQAEEHRGEGSEIEEYRGRTGLLVFTSIGTQKKNDNRAMVRGNAGVALWENQEAIGPSYWEAARILFWELEKEGGRNSEGVLRVPDLVEKVKDTFKKIESVKEEVDAPDTEPPPPPPKKKLTELGMYCPNPYDRAPQKMIEELEEADLRNYSDANANAVGKEAYANAVHGVPGGAQSEREQAFWSGSGYDLAKAKGSGFMVQEQSGGAKGLNTMNNEGKLQKGYEKRKDTTFYSEEGKDSGISNERIWKTISMRSAENAQGEVTAFVGGGQAQPGNVFASVELPTLLHNDKVKVIKFKNPDRPEEPAIVWKRNAKGCWEGDNVPGGVSESSKKRAAPNEAKPFPGFALHDQYGFIRPDPS